MPMMWIFENIICNILRCSTWVICLICNELLLSFNYFKSFIITLKSSPNFTCTAACLLLDKLQLSLHIQVREGRIAYSLEKSDILLLHYVRRLKIF